MKIKVLQVVGVMNRGGSEAMLMDIMRHKPDDIHFVFLVNDNPDKLGRTGSFDDEIKQLGGEIHYIGSQLRLGYRTYFKEFYRIVKETGATVVHSHLNAKNGIIAMAAHKAGIRCIISHCHADIRFRGSLISRIFNESEMVFQKILIHRYATDFWGCSLEANRRLYYKSDQQKSVVINNAITLDSFCLDYSKLSAVAKLRQSYNVSDDTLVLSNVGRIVPHKNIDFVVNIMCALKNRGKNSIFVVAGRNDSPDYVNKMKAHALKAGLTDDSLIFLGERDDIPLVLASSDVFVGPALREGFGLVAVEAQAALLPTVLYTGFPKTVDMGVGLTAFIDNFDAEKWAEAILSRCHKKVEFRKVETAIKSKGFDAVENSKSICKKYRKCLNL